MDKLQEAIENIGKFATEAGLSAKEFSEYLKGLAANAPIEAIEKEIHNLKIEKEENERWDWLDDIDE